MFLISGEKSWGDLINAYKYQKVGCKGEGARLFSVVMTEPEAMGAKSNMGGSL